MTKEGAVVIVNLSDWWAYRPLMRRQPGAEWVASGSRVCQQPLPNGRERFSVEADQAGRFVVERVRGRGQHVQRAGDRSRRSRLLGSYLSPMRSSRSAKSCMYWIWWVRPRCSWQAAKAGSAPIASAAPGVVRSIEPQQTANVNSPCSPTYATVSACRRAKTSASRPPRSVRFSTSSTVSSDHCGIRVTAGLTAPEATVAMAVARGRGRGDGGAGVVRSGQAGWRSEMCWPGS